MAARWQALLLLSLCLPAMQAGCPVGRLAARPSPRPTATYTLRPTFTATATPTSSPVLELVFQPTATPLNARLTTGEALSPASSPLLLLPISTSLPKQATRPTPTLTPAHRFTGQILRWFPNCGEVGISKDSLILDTRTGQPIDGVQVKIWTEGGWEALSLPSGWGKDYGPGQYDLANLCNSPCERTYYLKVASQDGLAVDSEVLAIHFDANDCRPEGNGHQVAIVNWYAHW